MMPPAVDSNICLVGLMMFRLRYQNWQSDLTLVLSVLWALARSHRAAVPLDKQACLESIRRKIMVVRC